MRNAINLCIAVLAAALLAACSDNSSNNTGSTDNSGARGSLMQNPPLRIASLTAGDFTAELNASPSGQQLLLVATTTPTGTQQPLPCGVDFHYIQYGTVDGGNPQGPTMASGALMVPTGGTGCSGARPILLYAHGTATDRGTNLADITNPNNSEGALIAAMFAAHGYIVIAPNYAGYDSSPLPYHPFLNFDQQSKEMIDALTAGRKALGNIFAASTTDNGKLFITGYSEGGHVAMATQRAMQQANPPITVTASGPMSGPYAVEAFGDEVFSGVVNLGSTIFAPLLTTSYQRAYGNIFGATTDIYETAYATGIDTLLPSTLPFATLFTSGKLPQTFLFNGTPPTTNGVNAGLDAFFATHTPPTGNGPQVDALAALGFSPPMITPPINLITNNYRLVYVADSGTNKDGAIPPVSDLMPAANPTHPLRIAFKKNDLRSPFWTPAVPTLLCGGLLDPTVFFANTQTMGGLWSTFPQVVVLDLESVPTGPTDPFTVAKVGFGQAKTVTGTAAAQAAVKAGAQDGGAAAAATAVAQAYHGTLVPPFCAAAVLGFFNRF